MRAEAVRLEDPYFPPPHPPLITRFSKVIVKL